MAQAGPFTDVTQRLFSDLKSKNEETRIRASCELYDNVIAVSRGMLDPRNLKSTLTHVSCAYIEWPQIGRAHV